jgi:predicted O-methyltransferase YrrM
MSEQQQTSPDFDGYISRLFAPEDDALRATREEINRENMPRIYVSPSEGKTLYLLALLARAKRILEIGTLGGYSTTWLARALPEDGQLISLEIDSHHAAVARRNLERAGLSEKVEVRLGPAAQTLKHLQAPDELPFDLVFIDADKDGYPEYLELSLPLIRDGGLILADNTLSPAVLDPQADTGITRYNKAVAAHPNLVSIIVPVLRSRGIGGLLISIKKGKTF